MLKLRPYRKTDAETIISWIRDEVSFRKWCADRYEAYPITAEDMNRNYEMCSESGEFYPMTAIDESGIVGHLILRCTDAQKMVIRFGFIIVDDKKRGMGYGKKMLEAAIRCAFEDLNAQKITLGVFDNNEAAYRCYRSVCFRLKETDNEVFYHIFNEDWKCLEMELFKKE